MKKKRSGKRLLLQILGVMMTITILCFLICGGYALYISEKEMIYCNTAALDIYLSGLSNTMENLSQFNENLSSDPDFNMLTILSPVLTSQSKTRIERNIRNMIQNRVEAVSSILVFNEQGNFVYYYSGSDFLGQTSGTTLKLITKMHEIREYLLSDESIEERKWFVYDQEGYSLLLNTLHQKNMYICAIIDIEAYASLHEGDVDNIDFCFITNEQILTNEESAEERGITLQEMLSASDSMVRKNLFHDTIQTNMNENLGLGLCGMISLSGVWGYMRIYAGTLVVTLAIVVILFLIIYRLLSRFLIYPLNKISEASKQLAEGITEIQNEPEQLQEYMEIQNALQQLVQQKVSLETERENEASLKEHALLQYYQLQTRSHFLLNCLKSIYNLTARGEKEKTLSIISLFSNHLRYIYHDSLKFVTIQQELDEVRDYFDIIEMERSDHILLDVSVDDSLRSFEVPPLIIQTFLENFNKHNGASDHVLRFAVKIDRVELDDREYVRVRMSDNGLGYSEESLQNLQKDTSKFEQYHVGIQNLCRRMDILYRGQYESMFTNGRNGGSVTVFYLPMKIEG